MTFTIHRATPDDAAAVLEMDRLGWMIPPEEVRLDDVLAELDWPRMSYARGEDGRMAGILGSWEMQLTVPGAAGTLQRTGLEGLTWASVHPDFRRRGVLSALMADQFARCREIGAPLAGLYASEPGIYARFGFGVAVPGMVWQIGTGTTWAAPEATAQAADEIETRLEWADSDDARARLLEAVHAAAATQLGSATLRDDRLLRLTLDRPEARRGKEPLLLLTAHRDGRAVGWCLARRDPKWEQGKPTGSVSTDCLSGVDDAVRLALLQRLTSLDLVSTVKLMNIHPLDPAVDWAGGHRASSGARPYDAVWLRLVDLPGAIAARGYRAGAPADVVLDVLDERVPDNAGLWVFRVSPDGTGSVERTSASDRAAEVRLDIRALGAAYLGQDRLTRLARTMRVEELTPGALQHLSDLWVRDEIACAGLDF